jgi:alcohol dehydrogenase (cytochrome c)
MKSRMAVALLLGGLVSAGAFAQTLDDLKNDTKNTENVLTYGMGYHQQRYSTLNQINKRTVRRLVPVWNLSLNNDFGEQAQPFVYDGVLYATNVKRTVAIDVATGRQLWQAVSDWDPATARVICCGLSTRGVAVYNGKVFVGTIDAHLKALDAKTGKEIWKVKLAEWKEGYSITSAPTVANGVLMQGIAGGEFGIRGFVDGYDPDTGKRLYRRHTTPNPGEKGSETWPPGDAYLKGGFDLDDRFARPGT